MFGSVMLDVAIGLVLVFLILSFVAAAVREALEVVLKDRAKLMHRGITELLHSDEALVRDFYQHPLISALYRGKTYDEANRNNDLPSYIPAKSFALALLDFAVRGRDAGEPLAAGAGASSISVASIRQNIALLRAPRVQRILLSAIDFSGGELAKVQQEIEHWFDSGMDRVSGWYKRKSQIMLLAIGLVVAGLANVDTLRVASSLYNDPGKRQVAVAMAADIAKTPPVAGDTIRTAAQLLKRMDELKLPIGWAPAVRKDMPIFMTFIGWLITAGAISLGAPFWFDMLNKIMVIRSTVKPHEKSPEEASEDRQPKPAPVTNINAGGGGANVSTPAAPVLIGAGADYRDHEWATGHAQEGVL